MHRVSTLNIAFLKLLEFTLTSYVHECGLKNPRRRELRRLEDVLKLMWTSVDKEVLEIANDGMLHLHGMLNAPTVSGILEMAAEHQDGPEDAICRFFLATRKQQ